MPVTGGVQQGQIAERAIAGRVGHPGRDRSQARKVSHRAVTAISA
jgi:hypothetical protein